MACILLIDDDPHFRGMLRQVLEKEGYEVVEAENGKEAMTLFRAEPTDLVISDIFMPDQEGLQTIRELREEFPDIKIIAISGGGPGGSMNFLSAAKLFGAQRTLWKPFDLAEFRRTVHDVMHST
jgi:CheY-like chemotaxis protein